MTDAERGNVVRSGRPAVGTVLHLPRYGRVTVRSNADPSLVVLETAQGTAFRIGERALAAMMEEAAGSHEASDRSVA